MLAAVLDLHSHILPGLDDGVRSIDAARELARSALADGITHIAATPHVRDDFPTTPDRMQRGVDELREDFRREGIALEVLTGGEVAIDRIASLGPDELQRFSLGGGGYLLVEFPYYGWPVGLERVVHLLSRGGVRTVLAHPERNGDVGANPGALEVAVENGALVQVTAASLDGRLGRAVSRTALALLERRLVHLIASDAHAPDLRAVGLSAAAAALRDPGLARFLTEEAPAAIVAGESVRPAPAFRRSHGRGVRGRVRGSFRGQRQ
jgi:protein-tyrosine phosphatase